MRSRPFTRLVFAIAGLVLVASPVRAESTQDKARFDKLIGKYAVYEPGPGKTLKGKVACGCTFDSPPSPGVLLRGQVNGKLFCGVPQFEPDGSYYILSYCQDFFVLGK